MSVGVGFCTGSSLFKPKYDRCESSSLTAPRCLGGRHHARSNFTTTFLLACEDGRAGACAEGRRLGMYAETGLLSGRCFRDVPGDGLSVSWRRMEGGV